MKYLDREFQVKKFGKGWIFCSYSTFLKHRKINSYSVRMRILAEGPFWNYFGDKEK